MSPKTSSAGWQLRILPLIHHTQVTPKARVGPTGKGNDMPEKLGFYPVFPLPFPTPDQWPEYQGISIPPPGTLGITTAMYHYQGFEIGTKIVVGIAYKICSGDVYLNFFRLSFLSNYLDKSELRSPDELGEWISRQYPTGNFAGIRIVNGSPGGHNQGWCQTLQLDGPSIIYEQPNLNQPREPRTIPIVSRWLNKLLMR